MRRCRRAACRRVERQTCSVARIIQGDGRSLCGGEDKRRPGGVSIEMEEEGDWADLKALDDV